MVKTISKPITDKMNWYLNDRFGMFIHWGIYSVYGHGEWARSRELISIEDYQHNFDNFDPQDFNPKKWARLAKNAGMKYAVLTSKHHDGFCLFDSQYTEYKSTNTPFKRDAVREFLDAFRAEGLKVGIYYSLLDWYHPDFPKYDDMYSPMRNNPMYKDETYHFDNYITYMHNQVKELCTCYGKLDLFWFDFSYDTMRGEKWKATELVQMIYKHQPDIILNNRLEVSGEGFGSIITENRTPYSGDFVTPEQIIPPCGVTNYCGKQVPWESCITMNNHWGYCDSDLEFKSSSTLIRKLVECVSKNGNLIINIGPDANGQIPLPTIKALNEIGYWMFENGESIYGCSNSGLDKPEYGRITRKGNRYYFHVTEQIIGPIPLHGIPKEKIKGIRLLSEGSELPIATSWVVSNYNNVVFVYYGDNEESTYSLPNKVDTVIEVTIRE